MATTFTDKEFYAQHFVPKDHMNGYYSFRPEKEAENAFLTFRLKNLHQIFIVDGIKGDTLIDIGSGPSIYQFISACESFREIIASDYADQNREELQRWLKNEPDAFDWSPVGKYVCELEGDREKWAEKEERLRRTIKQVLKCDITLPNPFAPLVLPPADCLLSSLCLETASKDRPSFCSALKNISSLLKPAGHLVLFFFLEETFYMVGQQRFSSLFVERKFLEDAVTQAGFDIKWIKDIELSSLLPISDGKGVCVVVAQKHLEG